MRVVIRYRDCETNTGFRCAHMPLDIAEAKALAESKQFIDVLLPDGSLRVIASREIIDMREE
jgi:hypothetical protein